MCGPVSEHRNPIYSVVRMDASRGIAASNNHIWQSWNRCVKEYDLDPARPPPVIVVEPPELVERQEGDVEVIAIARVEMISLYKQLGGAGVAVLLTDRDGVVLHSVGCMDFDHAAAKIGIRIGAVWTERAQGTNGIGTCLIERRPLIVQPEEHFLLRNIGQTCAAAPIFDPYGDLLCVLNMSSHSHLAQPHTLALVHMSAQAIENQCFLRRFRGEFIVRFHNRPEFVGTLGEGEIAVSKESKVQAANRAALFQLGYISYDQIEGRIITEIFNLTVEDLIDRSLQSRSTVRALYPARRGGRYFAIIEPPERTVPSRTLRGARRVPLRRK